MRLASFNLLHGRSLTDGLVDPARLRAAALDLAADVVGLQEVDRAQPRSHHIDLTAEVAAGMGVGPEGWRFEPALIGTPGGRWRAADGGEPAAEPAYGVGLVSRFPVRSWHVVRLRAAPARSPVLLPGSGRVMLLQDEPRVGLAAVVDTPLGVMTVATTHLSFMPVWNGVQLRWLVRALAALPGPRVLVGDLNLPGALPCWLSRWRSLAVVQTYPVDRPRVQLDHVLGDGSLPAVTGVAARDLGLSDHRALVVDLAD